MSGWLYLVAIAGARRRSSSVTRSRSVRNYSDALARRTFRYSIVYLTLLFAALIVDRLLHVLTMPRSPNLSHWRRCLCALPSWSPLGAYVRLSDAGLGCPDWPGCYGKLVGVPEHPDEQRAAMQAFPASPVETAKAWKEMIHRYVAGTLGLLILGIFLYAWRADSRRPASPALPTLLLVTVVLQAALGMLDGNPAAQADDRHAAFAGRHDHARLVADLAARGRTTRIHAGLR